MCISLYGWCDCGANAFSPCSTRCYFSTWLYLNSILWTSRESGLPDIDSRLALDRNLYHTWPGADWLSFLRNMVGVQGTWGHITQLSHSFTVRPLRITQLALFWGWHKRFLAFTSTEGEVCQNSWSHTPFDDMTRATRAFRWINSSLKGPGYSVHPDVTPVLYAVSRRPHAYLYTDTWWRWTYRRTDKLAYSNIIIQRVIHNTLITYFVSIIILRTNQPCQHAYRKKGTPDQYICM